MEAGFQIVMATFEEHCQETLERLGDRCDGVHKWLDEFSVTLGPEHRKVRHNAKGVAYCQRHWGDLGAHAAQMHIDRDLRSHIKHGALWVPKPKKGKDEQIQRTPQTG